MPDLTEDEIASTDFGTYTEDQFFDDMFRVTQYRTDRELCDLLVGRSFDDDAVAARQGHEVRPDLGPAGLQDRRQVQVLGRPDGRSQGRRPRPGASRAPKLAKKRGIEVRYNTRALELLYDGFKVAGVQVKSPGTHRRHPGSRR